MIKGQATFRNMVTFLFIIVGVIVISVFAVATTPFLNGMADSFNISGGMGLLVRYWNLLVVMILLFVGLFLVFGGSNR